MRDPRQVAAEALADANEPRTDLPVGHARKFLCDDDLHDPCPGKAKGPALPPGPCPVAPSLRRRYEVAHLMSLMASSSTTLPPSRRDT